MSQTVVFADNEKKAKDDSYEEGYDTQLEEQGMSRSLARERAEAYRALYVY